MTKAKNIKPGAVVVLFGQVRVRIAQVVNRGNKRFSDYRLIGDQIEGPPLDRTFRDDKGQVVIFAGPGEQQFATA